MAHRTGIATGIAAATWLCIATSCPAGAQGDQPAADAPHVAFQQFTLSNGLQVILHEDHKLPIAHVNMWFHVGSKDEKPGRTGLAHLFEHLILRPDQLLHHRPIGQPRVRPLARVGPRRHARRHHDPAGPGHPEGRGAQ